VCSREAARASPESTGGVDGDQRRRRRGAGRRRGRFEARGRKVTRLRVSHAFSFAAHGRDAERVRPAPRAVSRTMRRRIPIVSNVTGKVGRRGTFARGVLGQTSSGGGPFRGRRGARSRAKGRRPSWSWARTECYRPSHERCCCARTARRTGCRVVLFCEKVEARWKH